MHNWLCRRARAELPPDDAQGVAVVVTEQARPITYDCEHDSGVEYNHIKA